MTDHEDHDIKSTDLTTREGFEHAGVASLAALGLVVKQIPEVASNPALQAFMDIFLPTAGLSLGRGLHHLHTRRLPKFIDGTLRAFNGNRKKFQDVADERKADPAYHETMYRSFRSMMDALDADVVEALGMLNGQYLIEGKKPDWYFRGLGRLLSDLDSSEFDQLKRMLGGVVEAANQADQVDPPISLMDVTIISTGDVVTARFGGLRSPYEANVHPDCPSGARIIALMQKETLGNPPRAVEGAFFYDGNAADQDDGVRSEMLELPLDLVLRILRTIDPQPVGGERS